MDGAGPCGSSAGGAPRARALLGAGALAWQQGDDLAARNFLAESLTLWEHAPDQTGLAETLHLLGHVHFDQREYAEARHLFEESLARYEQTGNVSGKVTLIGDVGMVAYHERDDRRARDLFADSLRLGRQHGLKDRVAEALNRLGDQIGWPVTAEQRASAMKRACCWQELAALRNCWRSINLARSVESAAISSPLTRASPRVGAPARGRKPPGCGRVLAGLAGIALDIGMPERAARLLATSASPSEAMGAPLAPADQFVVASDIASGRLRLARSPGRRRGAKHGISHYQMLDEALAMSPLVVPPRQRVRTRRLCSRAASKRSPRSSRAG